MTDSKEMQKILQDNRITPTTIEDLDKRITFLLKALNDSNDRIAKLEDVLKRHWLH